MATKFGTKSAITRPIHRVSKESSTLYFVKYFRAGFTDCKIFNGYRVRENGWR